MHDSSIMQELKYQCDPLTVQYIIKYIVKKDLSRTTEK